MIRTINCFLIATSTIIASNLVGAKEVDTGLHGPYLGQTPPGKTAKVFAPGLLSTPKDREYTISFTPDLKELYFTRMNANTNEWWTITYKQKDNRWYGSTLAPRVGRPTLSPDGNTLHLGNQYSSRTDSDWSQVKSLGSMFNNENWGIMRLSSSSSGTYILDDYKNGDLLRISEVKNGVRQAPKPLPAHINTGKWNAPPFIAPDDSYIIWDGERPQGFGDTDLYISFRKSDGSWGKALNLGPTVNTTAGEAGGYMSPDGKYFFFNRTTSMGNGDIYWIDSEFIETLRSKG
ncbi:hypothetical protein L1077_07780 [Pseudoalteromonas luteoviolacea]|uniref:hypothetical protein n=1 Tax=Pseudoalteromonas luteoviolacea TaxID=43657 RepID=UPI001F298601|nr:hypothetical protein [Pseudoalteromonas luteoviolacea]MCF6439325.1 hypothetical protein [Pseudoalteromonas luteoviolacea]